MEKIISLFQRNYDGDRLVRNEVTPAANWVIAGEGVATRKFDGTCCMVRGGNLYKRYDAKAGRKQPEGFEPAQPPDPITGHWPGWVPVDDGPDDRWHREAIENHAAMSQWPLPDGTYELVGPKIKGNPDKFMDHGLVRHGSVILEDAPRDFDGLREYLAKTPIEGVVWHHPDGRMVKIKAKDFGIKR